MLDSEGEFRKVRIVFDGDHNLGFSKAAVLL